MQTILWFYSVLANLDNRMWFLGIKLTQNHVLHHSSHDLHPFQGKDPDPGWLWAANKMKTLKGMLWAQSKTQDGINPNIGGLSGLCNFCFACNVDFFIPTRNFCLNVSCRLCKVAMGCVRCRARSGNRAAPHRWLWEGWQGSDTAVQCIALTVGLDVWSDIARLSSSLTLERSHQHITAARQDLQGAAEVKSYSSSLQLTKLELHWALSCISMLNISLPT